MKGNDEGILTFESFCEHLIHDGAYIGEDGHIRRKNGSLLSRPCRNGYYLLRKMYGGHTYHFMEHRVAWYMVHGPFDYEKVINHKNFDRSDNRIENLELITQKENVSYSMEKNRYPDMSGCHNGRAMFDEKEIQAIRWMCKNGYRQKDVAEIFNVKNNNVISRIVTRARYGKTPDASSVIAVYPLIVEKTCRHDLSKTDRITNAVLGMAGEIGEVVDIVKKAYYQGHELDINHIAEELGDVMYYLCWLCIELEVDFSDICFANMVKLQDRYPDGFDAERSIHRPEYEVKNHENH